MEINDYYPYGLLNEALSMAPTDIINNYKYQDKQLQTEMGLHMEMFGLRQYDPQLARWHAYDPMLHTASPYTAMGGNPVSMVDPNGAREGNPEWTDMLRKNAYDDFLDKAMVEGMAEEHSEQGYHRSVDGQPVSDALFDHLVTQAQLNGANIIIDGAGMTEFLVRDADGVWQFVTPQTYNDISKYNEAVAAAAKAKITAPIVGDGKGGYGYSVTTTDNGVGYIDDVFMKESCSISSSENEWHELSSGGDGVGSGVMIAGLGGVSSEQEDGQISMDASHKRIGFVPLDVGENYGAYQMANYRCNISVRGNLNQITVRATSSNSPVADGEVVFGASASLVVNGNVIQNQILVNGVAIFKLPSSQNISLTVSGGWTVRYDYGGAAVPVFHPIFWPFSLNFTDNFKLK